MAILPSGLQKRGEDRVLLSIVRRSACSLLFLLAVAVGNAQDLTIDLLERGVAPNFLSRVYGSVGQGFRGVPVAGGLDINADGFPDAAFSAMLADASDRVEAGQVFVVLGNGSLGESLDSSQASERILRIFGSQASEHLGSEIWIDDVTGDGLGDLLLCRQDYTPATGEIGAGALTIIPGTSQLTGLAQLLTPLDLLNPPAGLSVLTLTGEDTQDRLCMWVRTGDVDGDQIADIVVGADQAGSAATHSGEAYVIRGGEHLNTTASLKIRQAGETNGPLAGNLARILPPAQANDYHFGATCQVADLDNNGRADVLVAAALNRAGGGMRPLNAPEVVHGSGGTPDGTLFIAWDDNFSSQPWVSGYTFNIASPPGTATEIDGGLLNEAFGEEILGGLDFDNDGTADLFVGDLTGNPPDRFNGGVGHVIYDAQTLRGLQFDIQSPPPGVIFSTIYGPIAGAIGADTAMQGDFNGDGIGDLAFSSPHDAPFGRVFAGTIHVLFGQPGRWPTLIDLSQANYPSPQDVRITEVYGANGTNGSDRGDTLSYSGAAGDMNGDGMTDLITNEMVGNGIAPDTVDVGNLIIISGAALDGLILRTGFEPAGG